MFDMSREMVLGNSEDWLELLNSWFGELGEFKPCISWHKGVDRLNYLTKDCSYVADSFGWYFAVLLSKKKIVGVSLEPFSGLVVHIRKTYPGMGVDGKDFPLWPLIALTTAEECLFPNYSRKRVGTMLPKIREFVGITSIPLKTLQEVRNERAW
jgi:hypothetical protein